MTDDANTALIRKIFSALAYWVLAPRRALFAFFRVDRLAVVFAVGGYGCLSAHLTAGGYLFCALAIPQVVYFTSSNFAYFGLSLYARTITLQIVTLCFTLLTWAPGGHLSARAIASWQARAVQYLRGCSTLI